MTLYKLINNTILTCAVNEDNIHIENSFCVPKRKDMISILNQIRKDAEIIGITYKRSNREWVAEWRAHNLLYELDIEKDRTGSVDLDESETPFRKIIYGILSFFYCFIKKGVIYD